MAFKKKNEVAHNPETGEVSQFSNLPSTQGPVTDDFSVGALEHKPTIKRQVTVPALSWPDGATIVFKSENAIKDGKELKGTRGGKANWGRARIMLVSAPNGALRTMICGAVLEGELTDQYPEEGYVGKWFVAKKIPANEEKEQRYATYQIMEIDTPEQALKQAS